MIEGLAACFAGLADPRETRRCDHQLIDILVIAVCAVIACVESWEDIQDSRMRPICSYFQPGIRSDPLDVGRSNRGFASRGVFRAGPRRGSQSFMREPWVRASLDYK